MTALVEDATSEILLRTVRHLQRFASSTDPDERSKVGKTLRDVGKALGFYGLHSETEELEAKTIWEGANSLLASRTCCDPSTFTL